MIQAYPTNGEQNMTATLAKRTMKELRQLAVDVEREIERRDQQRVIEARDRIYAIAQGLGMDVRDLLGKHSRDTSQKIAAVKFRNPANAQQVWSGRGRRPQWVTSLLAEGKMLADFGE
jgi:DNA-binding protein H-NS